MSTPDIGGVMAAAMDAENRRRELAGQSPGLGMALPLPQPVSGPGVGLPDVSLPVRGEGYDIQAEISDAVSKAYGGSRPSYGPPELGGYGYPLGIAQPARRHVSDIGDGRLLIEPGPDGRQPGSPYTVISPPARPGLLARLAARLRRR